MKHDFSVCGTAASGGARSTAAVDVAGVAQAALRLPCQGPPVAAPWDSPGPRGPEKPRPLRINPFLGMIYLSGLMRHLRNAVAMKDIVITTVTK